MEEEKDVLDFMNPGIELVVGIVVLLVFSLLGTATAYAYANWASNGMGLQGTLHDLVENNTLTNRDIVRYSNLLVHLFAFTLASIVVAWFVSKRRWVKYLKLNRIPRLHWFVFGVTLILVSLPFISLSYWINMQLPLPEWAVRIEDETSAMLEAMLTMNSPMELVSNLLVMAMVPAIGEELLFRGIILQYFEKLLKREHLAVWITAFIFSAIHFQFEGFIPRFLLGAILGYLFVWSRSIWVPIAAHFFFNGSQVAAKYFMDIEIEKANEISPNWIAGISSLVLSGIIINYLYNKRKEDETSRIK